MTDENIRVAFDRMSNHHEVITTNDLLDLIGEDETFGTVEDLMRENNMSPSENITFGKVIYIHVYFIHNYNCLF